MKLNISHYSAIVILIIFAIYFVFIEEKLTKTQQITFLSIMGFIGLSFSTYHIYTYGFTSSIPSVIIVIIITYKILRITRDLYQVY